MIFTYFGFLDELIRKGMIPNAKGCELEELKIIERAIKSNIPKAYLEFLLLAGKDSPWHNAEAGNIYSGFENMLSGVPETVRSYVEMGMHDLVIPKTFIPLWYHDGFSYINLNEGDNPPVYTFWGGPSAKHFISSDTFLGYIIKLVQHTLIDYSKFGNESGWTINSKIYTASNKDLLHKWRVLAEKQFG